MKVSEQQHPIRPHRYHDHPRVELEVDSDTKPEGQRRQGCTTGNHDCGRLRMIGGHFAGRSLAASSKRASSTGRIRALEHVLSVSDGHLHLAPTGRVSKNLPMAIDALLPSSLSMGDGPRQWMSNVVSTS